MGHFSLRMKELFFKKRNPLSTDPRAKELFSPSIAEDTPSRKKRLLLAVLRW